MKDGIIAETGNSRYLRSIAGFLQVYPTYEAFAAALANAVNTADNKVKNLISYGTASLTPGVSNLAKCQE